MKRCPQCHRVETDEALRFCRADGATLIVESSDVSDETRTGQIGDDPSEVHTSILPHKSQANLNSATGPTTALGSQKNPALIAAQAKPISRGPLVIVVAIAILVGLIAIAVNSYLSKKSGSAIESIAVMPFVNESGNAEVDYLSDGMTETLINTLTKLPNLNVKPRSSAFRYRGRESEAKSIGRELNVNAILNGRLVQQGDEITVFLALIDTGTENQIWGKQYTRKLANLVTLQTEIARDVSDTLKAKLSGADEQKLTKNYTQNAEAYQLYLKGRFSWNKRTEKDIQLATEFFQQAIALDPEYALAYAGLADTYAAVAVISNPDPVLRRERVALGRQAALKALSIDNNLPEAHTALGTVLTSFDYDFAGAEREYRRAIEINPDYADGHYWYAQLLSRLARYDEARVEYARTLELEPLNLTYQANYGGYLSWTGRHDEAIAYLQKTLELDESFSPTLGNLANVYELKGDYANAVQTRARQLELTGDAASAALCRNTFAAGGWEAYLRYLTSDRRPKYQSLYALAIAHAHLGEKDKAFIALNKSFDNREALLQRLKVDPRLDPLRNDPRFHELLNKIRFPE